jgi:anaerobic magnesium-protoporphyrin IX monomethyl ester cyclase
MTEKLLLVNPRHPERLMRMNIPLGLLYVGTAASHQGYQVNILDVNNYPNHRAFMARLEEELEGVFAVGLSVMTAQITSAIEISRRVRQVNPTATIIWGGVHPTMYPEQVAASEYADFAVKREGEATIVELLAAIGGYADPEQVKGIAFKTENGVVTTEDREPVDINRLPPLEWDLVEDIRSFGDIAEVARRTGVGMPIFTSRSCPHRCTFCINPVLKNKYRFRDAELVLKDIEDIVNLGVDCISFFDEDLFANRKRLMQIVDGIVARGLKFRWFAATRVDYFRAGRMDTDLLARIKDSGCQQLGFGAESGSQRILDYLKKDITVEDTIHAARIVDSVDIDATFSFMIALPGEEDEDIRQTVELITRIAGINSSFRILGPFIYRPYPGSELYFQCLKEGMKEPATLEEWAISPYVGNEIHPADFHLFPWARYPMEDLTRLIFYSWMAGLRLRLPFLTRLARAIGSLRCRHLFFRWPVERSAVRLLRRFQVDRLLSAGKFE